MNDFEINDDELNDILGLSDRPREYEDKKEYSSILDDAKNRKRDKTSILEIKETKIVKKLPFLMDNNEESEDVLSSIADIHDSEDEISHNNHESSLVTPRDLQRDPQRESRQGHDRTWQEKEVIDSVTPKDLEIKRLNEIILQKEEMIENLKSQMTTKLKEYQDQLSDMTQKHLLQMEKALSSVNGMNQLQSLVNKLEMNTKIVNGLESNVRNGHLDNLKARESSILAREREIEEISNKNQIQELEISRKEKELKDQQNLLEMQSIEFEKQKQLFLAQKIHDQTAIKSKMDEIKQEKEKILNESHLEKLNSLKLEEEWNQERSKLLQQISKDKNIITREKAELELIKKIQNESQEEFKNSLESEREALKTERSILEREQALLFSKVADYQQKQILFKIEKQSLESELLALKTEREILSAKEFEISKNLSQITRLKHDLGKRIIENARNTIAMERVAAIQNRIDFAKENSIYEALQLTSNVPLDKNLFLSERESPITSNIKLKSNLENTRLKHKRLEMVESTFELPVIDVSSYLNNPSSKEALDECKRAANAFLTFSACSILDQRVTQKDNLDFLNLLEDYFDQPSNVKMMDVRAELSYQVGATPELTELPRCGRDPKCLEYIDALSAQDKPHGYDQKDPKWRFFWRIGEIPKNTQFKQLNAPSVQPQGFPTWSKDMNSWGNSMLSSVQVLSEMLAIGFGMPKESFTDMIKGGPHLLAPTASDLEKYNKIGTVLAGFHTDLNFVTIHGKSRFPGLYIWTSDNKKLLVRIRDGCLLVQAGKQFEWLTGGIVRAGFHEVVVTEETIKAIEVQKAKKRPLWRISSTLFSHIASDQVLEPLTPFKNSPTALNYPKILAGHQVEEELKFISLKSD